MPIRVGVAGIPGAWSTERICDSLRAHGIESFSFSLADCVHDLSSGQVTLGACDLADLDGVVVKKLGTHPSPSARLRLHMLRALEQQSVRVFSPTAAIERAMDRYRMQMDLADAGLPVPATYAVEGREGIRAAVERLGGAVIKPVYTSKGRGMTRADGDRPYEENHIDGPALVQKFVQSPGRDIGACVLGGQFLSAFYRVAKPGAWMTTTDAGGEYAPCCLDRRGIELSVRASEVFGLDYTVVDLVETAEGYQIYEVSAFGGFRGLWQAGGIDVADAYAQYIGRSLSER